MIETTTKLVMGALLVAAAPVTDPSLGLWAQWGLAGVVVAYVLWRDAQREQRLSGAIEHQQQWIRETLVAALERNATAMERMVDWLEARDAEDPRRAPTRRLTQEARHADHR